MNTLEINKDFLDSLFAKAKENPRLRQNYDLRTSAGSKPENAQCSAAWYRSGDTSSFQFIRECHLPLWQNG